MTPPRLLLPLLSALVLVPPADGSFHLMQIERVLGGACGDTSVQAVQLRLRSSGQHLVQGRRLVATDASGANPIVVIDFPQNAANGAAGSRILVGTSAFDASRPGGADFVADEPIPESYLEAGRLVFDDGAGTVYWSLAWGGEAYTGPTTGATTNDVDGDFGPPFPAPLPSTDAAALVFQGSSSDLSTTNADDYEITDGAAIFTDNSGGTALGTDCAIFSDGFESGDVSRWSDSVP